MLKMVFRKSVLAAMVAALVFAALPITSVFAADEPPAGKGELTDEKLEQIWARELKAYDRLGKVFERSDAMFEKAQGLIERAAENGKDVSAVQAALDAFESAVAGARPIYDDARSIVTSHAGFDGNGKVTDAEQARATVKELGAKLKEVKSAMGGTGKALREAIKAFREANRPAEPANRE